MAFSYFTQLFGGGMNQDMAPTMLDLSVQNSQINIVASVQNIIFERGEAVTRPGATSNPVVWPSGSIIRAVKALPFSARTVSANAIQQRMGFFIRNDGTLWALQALESLTALSTTQITGAGFTQSSDQYCDHGIVNGVVLIAGAFGGLIRWDPATTVYTLLSTAKYQYVCGHLSRAVAAFDVSQTSTGYQSKVAWSAPGDETTWTGSTSGAGSTVLSDCEDAITGVKVCNGVVAIARAYGFHIAIPTGQFPAVYDFRKLSSMSVGCMHPATFLVYKNTMFFMSANGIHTFDFADITDIGEGVYKEISWFINNQQMTPRAFMSNSYAQIDFQPSYNICLESVTPTPQSNITPHYMYNIRERKWTRHIYNNNISVPGLTNLVCGFEFIPDSASSLVNPSPLSLLTVVNRGANALSVPFIQTWSGADAIDGTGQAALETQASITTGQITLDDSLHDMQVERIQLFYYTPSPSAFVITANGVLANNAVTTKPITVITPAATGWNKQWVNFRLTCNTFSLTLTWPLNTPGPIRLKQIVFEYTSVGKVRV